LYTSWIQVYDYYT